MIPLCLCLSLSLYWNCSTVQLVMLCIFQTKKLILWSISSGMIFWYVKSLQIRSYFWFVFSCIQTVFLYSCIQAKYRKIRSRNNSVFGHFSRSEPFSDFSFSNTTTKSVADENILGTVIENKLDFKSHLKNICKNAKQKLSALART